MLFSSESTCTRKILRCVAVSGQDFLGCGKQLVREQVSNPFSWFRLVCVYIEVLFGTSVHNSRYNNG